MAEKAERATFSASVEGGSVRLPTRVELTAAQSKRAGEVIARARNKRSATHAKVASPRSKHAGA